MKRILACLATVVAAIVSAVFVRTPDNRPQPGKHLLAWRISFALVLVGFLSASHAAEMSANVREFSEQVRKCWAQWDRDQNGELSVAELDAVVSNPETRGPEAAAVAALKRATRSRKYNITVLTVNKIEEILESKPAPDRPDLAGMYAAGLKAINDTKPDLFVSGKPKLDTIHQGKLGNCFCLAPLGALVHRSPERVVDMFHAEENGTYCVLLGTRRVTIVPPTDAELAQMARNEQDGIWVNLYEKAVGEARNRDRIETEQLDSPIDLIATGGSAGTMLSYITGHKIQRFTCAFAKDAKLSDENRQATLKRLRKWLRQATEDRSPMTCGTPKKITLPGLHGNHAYAVLDYLRDEDIVELWDPHGSDFTPKGDPGPKNGYPCKDGVFRMPLAIFVQEFAGLAVETSQPVDTGSELPRLP